MANPCDPTGAEPETGETSGVRERAQYWVARLVGGEVSASELDALELWLAADPRHAHAFSRERALWQDLAAAADVLSEPVASRPMLRRRVPRGIGRRQLVRALPMALAASIVAAFVGPSLVLAFRADHRTATGEVRSVALPDGTTARLDSGSAISVGYDGNRRVVHMLAGRAWFDVRHERRPFLVEALGGTTEDIGTGFEVQREGGTVEISVTQGAVQVHAPEEAVTSMLHAGDRLRYTRNGIQRLASQSVAQLAAWRSGELLFEQQPVTAAIAEIARYRRAPVWTIGDFSDVSCVSGLFLVDRPDEALETLVRMRGLRLLELPGGAIVIRPGAPS